MSKVTFETELNDEALGALRSYLAKRNEQLDMRLDVYKRQPYCRRTLSRRGSGRW